MNKKIILSLFTIILISQFSIANALSSDLNKRLESCTPTRDYSAGGSTFYRISGLTGSICIFRIINNSPGGSDLICRVPYTRMREVTSFNPMTAQNVKNQYCIIALKK